MNIRKSIIYFFSLLAIATLSACGGDDNNDSSNSNKGTENTSSNDNQNVVTTESAVARLEFPHLHGGSSVVIVHRTGTDGTYDPDNVNFSTEWDCDLKSQRWSCYTLTKTNKVQKVSRYYGDPQYPNDPALTSSQQLDQDYYYGSSYGTSSNKQDISFDHGHICPSNDRRYTSEANYQTFYLTNMQPQYKVFNGSHPNYSTGLWLKMENFVNKLGLSSTDTLYVCKGGTIDKEENILTRISGKLIVPKYFFVALLLKNSLGYRAIGFWFPHTNVYHGDDALATYAVTIDKLEELTGIDFFCNLPDKTEKQVESSYVTKPWGL